MIGDVTSEEPNEEPDNIAALFDSLHRAVVNYTGEETAPINIEDLEPERVRSTLYMWADKLLRVPFSPDKE